MPAWSASYSGRTFIPNLWKPGRSSYYRIEALPLTGSGKLDVKTLRQRAAELATPAGGSGDRA